MATAAATIALETEKIIQFAPDALAAPFPLRCAALCIDYMVLLGVPILWLVLARFLSDTGVPDAIGKTIWTLGILLSVIDCILLPILLSGRTFGKLLTGIRIVRIDGSRPHAGQILLRNTVGYLLTLLTLGLGFFFAAVNGSGRALHDYLSGTIVIRGSKRPA